MGLGLLAALAVTTTACDADVLNDLAQAYTQGADAGEVNSADNGVSIDIGGDRRLILVNDPYVGPVNGNGTRQHGVIAGRNGLLVLDTDDGSIDTYLGPGGGSRFSPPTPGRYYWLTGGIADGNVVHILAQERPGGANWADLVNNVVLTVSTTTFTVVATEVLSVPTDGPVWGDSVLDLGGHTYLYGHLPSPLRTVLARAPQGSVDDETQWEFWTGSAWSDYQANAAPLVDDRGNELPYLLVPNVNAAGGLDMLAYRGPYYTDDLEWAASAGPTRPVTVGGVAYSPPEAHQPCGSGGLSSLLVYSVHSHTNTPADETVWSYSTNCTGPGGGSPYIAHYRPRYINLDLADAPEPCPILSSTVVQKFTRATYQDLNGAAPTSGQLSAATAHIATAGFCRSDLTDDLLAGDTYLDGLVEDLYQQLLGRAAGTGTAFWTPRLRDRTDTYSQAARSMAASSEFYALSGGTDAGFVDRLYETMLDRDPSAGDVTYWSDRLASGVSRNSVAGSIFQSDEGRGRRIDALAGRFHLTLDSTARAHWKGVISTNGGDDIAVSRALAIGAQYLANAQSRF